MPIRVVANHAHLAFYGNRRTREVHNMSSHSPNCRVGDIKGGVKFVPDTLQEARRYRYSACPHCINRRQYRGWSRWM